MENTKKFVELLKSDPRFTTESYRFVNEALSYAQSILDLGETVESDVPVRDANAVEKHITGQDLCQAAKDYAISQYGLMAKMVLANLGIRKTSDIGDIVYHLIDIGYMRKTKEDRREDFDNVFDLAAELDNGFSIEYKK
ncbi:MAG: hypothetical protein Q4C95_04040 [Planctomycetia bacterium]|nr:hypothetical protein [Planctomycetia bacterium]